MKQAIPFALGALFAVCALTARKLPLAVKALKSHLDQKITIQSKPHPY
jgi:ABC-type Fe3+ transport system permease subunit